LPRLTSLAVFMTTCWCAFHSHYYSHCWSVWSVAFWQQ